MSTGFRQLLLGTAQACGGVGLLWTAGFFPLQDPLGVMTGIGGIIMFVIGLRKMVDA